MVKTVRYRDPENASINLGVLDGDDVYSITRKVPNWTDPVPMWHALQALGITPSEAVQKFLSGSVLSFRELERDGLLLPPVVAPEVWASGVTYERSRQARNAETQRKEDSVYDRVYIAERPELFFKSTYERLVPPGKAVALRADSHWIVPEPELSIVISAEGELIGWTIGNDLSSRDIEGENPLYLPQAKVFAQSCSFGPVLLWNTGEERPEKWDIQLTIWRYSEVAFKGSVSFSQFRRSFRELISYLLRDNPIQDGTVLMTGTGVVPPDEFTLQPEDMIEIAIDNIGVLRNPVASPLQRTYLHDLRKVVAPL